MGRVRVRVRCKGKIFTDFDAIQKEVGFGLRVRLRGMVWVGP